MSAFISGGTCTIWCHGKEFDRLIVMFCHVESLIYSLDSGKRDYMWEASGDTYSTYPYVLEKTASDLNE